MSYKTIAASRQDRALQDRVIAATVQEAWAGGPAGDTAYGQNVRASEANAVTMIYPVCSASDVEAAYASALAAGNPDPGGDETAVTDGQILGAVQGRWPADEVPV
jgi:hypothetical protein